MNTLEGKTYTTYYPIGTHLSYFFIKVNAILIKFDKFFCYNHSVWKGSPREGPELQWNVRNRVYHPQWLFPENGKSRDLMENGGVTNSRKFSSFIEALRLCRRLAKIVMRPFLRITYALPPQTRRRKA
jgi:hypothetical protein